MKKIRKTKIIGTLGPAVDDDAKIRGLITSGLNICRLNFSHGSHDEHLTRIQRARKASAELEIPVAFMLDTKGPEIRTGAVKDDGTLELHHGNRIVLTTETVAGTEERLSISYAELPDDVVPGMHIFVADGLIDLEVEEVRGTEIVCMVRNGGLIGSRKNVNVPGVRTRLPAMTKKDIDDILFGLHEKVDFIAASFIRKAENVQEIKNLLHDHKSEIRVIAKIEDEEGLENIEDIIRVSDGIMIARGDLGVQLSTELIPMAQKRIIHLCNTMNKPVIVATQMLDSMIHNPKPTRAETTDVANAIFDGADCVMLSGETAGGRYPVESVAMLDKIARAVEESEEYRKECQAHFYARRNDTSDMGHAIARAAYVVADEVGASAIIAPSLRGNSPRVLSQFRPQQDIIAVTVSDRVQRQLLIHWGVTPIKTEFANDSDAMIQNAIRVSLASGYVGRLDRVVTAAGIPVNSPIMMNTVKVHFLGNILNRGQFGCGKLGSGRIVKCEDAHSARRRLRLDGGEIMLTRGFTKEHLPLLEGLAGVIVENETPLSPEDIQSANPDIAFIGEVPDAYTTFEENFYVSLDGEELLIYEGIITGE
ncbi:MAG: pyruvate kinase [Spirochaetaceae bacterium]|nr:MAG: pyruvate kinase [Spirochaetaceae bacterium]